MSFGAVRASRTAFLHVFCNAFISSRLLLRRGLPVEDGAANLLAFVDCAYPNPPPNFACTSSSFFNASVSILTKTVSRLKGTTSRTLISTGVSFLGNNRPGERAWRVWKNVRKAGDAAGKTNDECGR